MSITLSKELAHWLAEFSGDDKPSAALASAIKNGALTREMLSGYGFKLSQEAQQGLTDLINRFGPDAHLSSAERWSDAAERAADEALQTRKSFMPSKTTTTPFGVVAGMSDAFYGKAPSERLDNTEYTAKHARTGEPVRFLGEDIKLPSARERYKTGVYFKYTAHKSGVPVSFNDYEKQILAEMFAKETWTGEHAGQYYHEIPGMEAKALLEDSGGASNGIQLNPIFFDSRIITYPLLSGELSPLIEWVDMPRGNLVQGATLGNPTVTWNPADGTAFTLFDTASLVGNLNTNVFDVTCGIEVGRNILLDSPIEIADALTERVAARYAAEFDKVIAVGDGTTQPTGLINTSAATTVFPSFPRTGPITTFDPSTLMFGIAKQYRQPQMNPVFVSNDTMYRRVRDVPVGTDDSRRAFGEDIASYKCMNADWRIANDLPDGTLMYACLRKYRMYRRGGIETRWCDMGQTLMQKNTSLMVMRARMGGRQTDPASIAIMKNAATSG